MSAAWITLDDRSMINAAIVVQWCRPEDLKAWRGQGRKPMLVDFGAGNGCKIGAPIPAEARLIETES